MKGNTDVPDWNCGKCGGRLDFRKELSRDVLVICSFCKTNSRRQKPRNWIDIKSKYIDQSQKNNVSKTKNDDLKKKKKENNSSESDTESIEKEIFKHIMDERFPNWSCGKCKRRLIFHKEARNDIRAMCIICEIIHCRRKPNNWTIIKSDFVKRSQLLKKEYITKTSKDNLFAKKILDKIEENNNDSSSSESEEQEQEEEESDSEEESEEDEIDDKSDEKEILYQCLETLDSIEDLDKQIKDLNTQKNNLDNLMDSDKKQLKKLFEQRKIDITKFFKSRQQ
jgi:hypothetical protein